ncbi:MAG: hypothetical protein LBU64_10835 [Planctomycetota bacterium]|nr:hypothetical protein [Planctomycetota bacterium]
MNDNWKKRLAVPFAALVVLLAGIATGSGLTILYLESRLAPPPSDPESAARLITAKLSDSVGLSPEEKSRVEELVRRRMGEIADIRKKYEAEIEGKLGSLRVGLTGVIGKERMEKCGEWMRRFRPPPGEDAGETGGGENRCGGGSGCHAPP